jgi:peptide/nickel transport system permease protein
MNRRAVSRPFWRRFVRHRLAVFGTVTLGSLLVFLAIASLLWSEADANRVDTALRLRPPSASHPFGTDAVGRDILARVVHGGQVSLLIGVAAVTLSLLIGVPVGALAGYYGGRLDALLMRLTEAILIMPPLFLLIIAVKFLHGIIPSLSLGGKVISPQVTTLILIIGGTTWPGLARLVRVQILTLKEREFVLAARSLGASPGKILWQHLLPNSLAPIVVYATLGIANAILSESYISFLGLGVQPPTATWGNLLEDAPRYLVLAPWLWLFPGGCILLTVLAINGIGDGLRDALDPRPSSGGRLR